MTGRGTIIVTSRVAYSCDHKKYSDLKFFSEPKRRIQAHFSYSERKFSMCKFCSCPRSFTVILDSCHSDISS
jgi:hypothetical protein